MIRAAAGLSTESDATRAVLDVARAVHGQLGEQPPDWAIVFVTSEHGPVLGRLLPSLSQALGTPYVAGCSASGVMMGGTAIEQGPALAVLGVRSDQLRATPFLFPDSGDHGWTAGVEVAERLSASRDRRDLLLVWPDPYHVRPDRLLHGLRTGLASVPVVGGAASGRGHRGMTWQFAGEEQLSSGVAGLRLEGEFAYRIGVTQGCRPISEPLRVTSAHENLILEIEGRPALDVLRDADRSGLLSDLHRALGLLFVRLVDEADPESGEQAETPVCSLVAIDPDTGVLAIGQCVEEGQTIVFAERDPETAREDLTSLIAQVDPSGTGGSYRFGLYFNCVARGRCFQGAGGGDAGQLARAFPELPLVGFFSNAELGFLNGANQVFTYSGVLVLVGE